MEIVLFVVVALIAGFGVGYSVRKVLGKKSIQNADAKAEKIISEAKNREKELLLKAKDKALKIIDDAKQEESQRRKELNHMRERLEKRENTFDQKLLDLESRQQDLDQKIKDVEEVKAKITKLKQDHIEHLEKISGMNKDEAKELLLSKTEREIKEDLLARIQKLQKESYEEVEKEAKKILANAIQRCSVNHASESMTTTIDLPNDEMKGRIIGREGRNIRALEHLTGVEIIIDDTPNVITISAFSPIRRHIAKKAIDSLIVDGRIHPAKIESSIEQAKKEIALEMKEAGEEAMRELGITGFDPKLIQIIGRLKFRTSYGQNVLRHSIESAHIAGLLAEELGADVTIAKKGALLHDIGKAFDHDVQGTHDDIGHDIARRFNLSEEIVAPIIYHHEEVSPTLECLIVKVCDAISGGRPGARKDSYEQYIQRLLELEESAMSFAGVQKAFAIEAGREVRIFVEPDAIDDLQATKLAQDIARKIEAEIQYPGEVKVNVIREKRIVEWAR